MKLHRVNSQTSKGVDGETVLNHKKQKSLTAISNFSAEFEVAINAPERSGLKD